MTKLYLIVTPRFLLFGFPNGLLIPYGPFRGGANDAGCALEMGLSNLLSEKLEFPGRSFLILADGGFGQDEQVVVPHRGQLSAEEANYNLVHSFHRLMSLIIQAITFFFLSGSLLKEPSG